MRQGFSRKVKRSEGFRAHTSMSESVLPSANSFVGVGSANTSSYPSVRSDGSKPRRDVVSIGFNPNAICLATCTALAECRLSVANRTPNRPSHPAIHRQPHTLTDRPLCNVPPAVARTSTRERSSCASDAVRREYPHPTSLEWCDYLLNPASARRQRVPSRWVVAQGTLSSLASWSSANANEPASSFHMKLPPARASVASWRAAWSCGASSLAFAAHA